MNEEERIGLEGAFADFGRRHPGTTLTASACADPPAIVVAVDGSLDGGNAEDFQRVLVAAFAAAKGRGGLVLDLAALKYASSSGVGAFALLLSEAKRHELPFYLARIPGSVGAILDLLGFRAFFNCLETLEAPP